MTITYPLLSVAAILFSATTLNAQCIIFPNAVAGITLQDSSGTNNRSGVAFNPTAQLYYSVNAGSGSYPIETFDITGSKVASIASGYDYRGLWWNTTTSQLEGNPYGGGNFSYQNLNAAGIPLGTVTNIATSTQPDGQSCGVLNFDDNEIIYNYTGSIHRYSRVTGLLIGTTLITGLPVPLTNINSTSVIYTGCVGNEIGIYDYVLHNVYFISKTTGAYSTTTTLPFTAAGNDRFRFAYANNLVWVFEPVTFNWHSFSFLTTGIEEQESNHHSVFPNPFYSSTTISLGKTIESGEIKIINLHGQTVFFKKIKQLSELKINKQDLPSGVYFYFISDENKNTQSGKLISVD